MKTQIAVLALAAAAVAACSPDRGITSAGAAALHADRFVAHAVSGSSEQAVYTLTNQISGNAVAIFTRAADGRLTAAGTVSTGGTGTGAGLGSQGALALTDEGRLLFAVNAGSNEISAFVVSPEARLSLVARVPSGGTQPISLTVHEQLLYVLNAGGRGNIIGFTIGANGALSPIPGSTRQLTGAAVGPAQVAFSPDGRLLVVTEKTANLLAVYTVGPDGVATGPTAVASAGVTPFGFAFGLRQGLFVSEAAGTASSYEVGENGRLAVISGAVATHQGAPCWLVVTTDGRFAYTANAHSGTISGFRVGPDASLSLLDASGLTANVGAGNIDLALTTNSRYLYQLHGSGTITALRVQDDGALETIGVVGGLSAGVAGLAAR
jgi:6-phosphogluconolactonase (cycloisomerase 2 family)